jgi:transketolase
MASAHFKLGTMIAIVDRNQLSIDGFTEDVLRVEPIEDKFKSFGWNTVRFDGHDFSAILRAIAELPAADSDTPTVLIADTVKGRGVRRMEFNTAWHVGGLVGTDYDEVLEEIRAGLQPQEDAR